MDLKLVQKYSGERVVTNVITQSFEKGPFVKVFEGIVDRCEFLSFFVVYSDLHAILCSCNRRLRESVVLMTTVGAEKNKGDPWGGQISFEEIIYCPQILTADCWSYCQPRCFFHQGPGGISLRLVWGLA